MQEIDIKQELGQKSRVMRNKLLALSLSNPGAYYRLKDKIEEQVIQHLTDITYHTFLDLLTKGIINKIPLMYDTITGGEDPFVPDIPYSIAREFAINASLKMEDLAVHASEFLLPKDGKDLAFKKSSDLLKVVTGL